MGPINSMGWCLLILGPHGVGGTTAFASTGDDAAGCFLWFGAACSDAYLLVE